MNNNQTKLTTPNGDIFLESKRLSYIREETKKNVVDFLSSSPANQNKVIDQLTQEWIDCLVKIKDIGVLDFWYNETQNEYIVTIKWLEDCTDWFIWAFTPIIGTGNDFSKAIIDLKKNIDNCYDFVVRDQKSKVGYWNISFNKKNKKYYRKDYVVYSNIYKDKLNDEQLFNSLWWEEKYKDMIIRMVGNTYTATSNVFFNDDNSKLTIEWNNPIDAWNNFIQHLKNHTDWYYQNWEAMIHYTYNITENNFLERH